MTRFLVAVAALGLASCEAPKDTRQAATMPTAHHLISMGVQEDLNYRYVELVRDAKTSCQWYIIGETGMVPRMEVAPDGSRQQRCAAD